MMDDWDLECPHCTSCNVVKTPPEKWTLRSNVDVNEYLQILRCLDCGTRVYEVTTWIIEGPEK